MNIEILQYINSEEEILGHDSYGHVGILLKPDRQKFKAWGGFIDKEGIKRSMMPVKIMAAAYRQEPKSEWIDVEAKIVGVYSFATKRAYAVTENGKLKLFKVQQPL